MIFIDTNYFLRLMVEPQTPEDHQMIDQAFRLFRSARDSDQKVTTSDAVLGEIFFTLSGPTYRFSQQRIAKTLRPLLAIRGMKSPVKHVWLECLDTIERNPEMKFVDALAASYCLKEHMRLATFDKKLARFPGVSPYQAAHD